MQGEIINPAAVYETSWWEYVRGVDGEIMMSQFVDGISSPLLRNLDTGQMLRARDLPVGALYALDRSDCTEPNQWPPAGADGLSIVCKTINSTWYIENRASNCTMPEDRNHRCWVRHGTVREKLTVDKAGLTCGAGAGSFFMGRNSEWHGFLRDGKLTP